jgi:hypothetical protein
MAEVERETGVPAPTLYQWAARGRWRASDLAEAALREAEEDREACHGPVYPGCAGRSGGEALQPHGMDPPDTPGDDRGEGMSADPTTPDALRAEAERCFQAAMALSRRGRMKDADAALKLAERYRALAAAAEGEAGGPGAAAGAAPDPAKVDAAGSAAVHEIWPRIMGLVKLALKGKVDCLPHWATTKEFLADTLYPDMYYRHPPRSGTPIAGHYGPGPCDALIEEEEARQADARADGERTR